MARAKTTNTEPSLQADIDNGMAGCTEQSTGTGLAAGNAPVQRMSAFVDFLLGQKLRKIRKEQGLTLKELSQKSGLSLGTVSQIERGVTSASVKSLTLLSGALNVPLDAILNNIDGPKSEANGYVTHANHHMSVTEENKKITKFIVTPANAQYLDMYTTRMQAGGTTGDDLYITGTEEIVGLVINGRLNLHLGNEQLALKAGDSFCYPGQMPRGWSNPGPGENYIVYAITRSSNK